jgi:hypothetical protein
VAGSGPPYGADGYSDSDSPVDENTDVLFNSGEDPSPWYFKPWVLALWGVAVVTLIATIIYGLVELATGSGGGGPTTTPSSTTRSSSTSRPSPTPTTSPTLTTTPTETTTPVVPPETTAPPAPPVTTQPWTPQHPRRHWWNGNLPNVPNLPHLPGVNP